jgi:hypothetical protein
MADSTPFRKGRRAKGTDTEDGERHWLQEDTVVAVPKAGIPNPNPSMTDSILSVRCV